ncbi:hypothetical protein COOONC_00230 [Cooperia oncophora]
MVGRSQRTAAKKNGPNDSKSVESSQEANGSQGGALDVGKLSAADLLRIINERKWTLYLALCSDFTEAIENEKRARTIVVYGLEEPNEGLPLRIVKTILRENILKVECRPCEVYRMGKRDPKRPRLVKVVLPLAHCAFQCPESRRMGGGVCCFVKGNIHDEFVTHITAGKADGLCFDLFFPTRSPFTRLITVYRPPNLPKDDALIEVHGDLAPVRESTVILGDLNLQVEWNSPSALNSASAAYMDFFRMWYGTACQAAHSQWKSSHNILDVSVLPPLATSDHNVVSFNLLEESSPLVIFPDLDFLNTDFTALNNYFLSIDWWALLDQYFSVDDIYQVYQRFCRVVYTTLGNGLAHTAPFKSIRRSGLKYSLHISNLVQQKERLLSELSSPLGSVLYGKVCSVLNHHRRKFLTMSAGLDPKLHCDGSFTIFGRS